MCGRFHNHVQAMHNWTEVLADWPVDFARSFNVSPTQQVPIVIRDRSVVARWGLVPSWEKAFSTRYPTHNARLETVSEKASFRSAWKESHTCLVPMGGFYEWRKEGNHKQPYFIYQPNDLLVCAGLFEERREGLSFTILTHDAIGPIAQVHHRMPLMLSPAASKTWLDRGTAAQELIAQSVVHNTVELKPVSRAVNSSRNDGPELLERIDIAGQE